MPPALIFGDAAAGLGAVVGAAGAVVACAGAAGAVVGAAGAVVGAAGLAVGAGAAVGAAGAADEQAARRPLATPPASSVPPSLKSRRRFSCMWAPAGGPPTARAVDAHTLSGSLNSRQCAALL